MILNTVLVIQSLPIMHVMYSVVFFIMICQYSINIMNNLKKHIKAKPYRGIKIKLKMCNTCFKNLRIFFFIKSYFLKIQEHLTYTRGSLNLCVKCKLLVFHMSDMKNSWKNYKIWLLLKVIAFLVWFWDLLN